MIRESDIKEFQENGAVILRNILSKGKSFQDLLNSELELVVLSESFGDQNPVPKIEFRKLGNIRKGYRIQFEISVRKGNSD